MTSTEQAYNLWAAQYDTNINRTRDLEAKALRSVLGDFQNLDILEIGCGTGKNSEWLITKAKSLLGVDLSANMLNFARLKVIQSTACFIEADIQQAWDFTTDRFDLITFSLVLEHIGDLDFIFTQASQKLKPGGLVYVGELHPFKQYSGTKARFDTENGRTTLECFTHHVSDFTKAAQRKGFAIQHLEEWFDEDDRSGTPRILTLLLRKM